MSFRSLLLATVFAANAAPIWAAPNSPQINAAAEEQQSITARAKETARIARENAQARRNKNDLAGAADILSALLAAPPPNLSEFDRMLVIDDLADIETDRKNYQKAFSYYQDSLKIAEALAARNSNNENLQRNLAIGLRNIGDSALANSQPADARINLNKALKIARRLHEKNPKSSRITIDLWGILDSLGQTETAEENWSQALRHYEQAAANLQAITETDVKPEKYETVQNNLYDAYESLGSLKEKLNEPEAAEKFYLRGIEIVKGLTRSHPDDQYYQREVSVFYELLGELAESQNQLPHAARYHQKGLEISRRLVENSPKNYRYQYDLVISYRALGRVKRTQNLTRAARKNFELGVKIAEPLVAAQPDNQDYQFDLSLLYDGLAAIARENKKWKRALGFYEKSLAIGASLARQNSGELAYQTDLAICYQNLGKLANAMGDQHAEIDNYRKELAIRRLVHEKQPDTSDYKIALAIVYVNLAVAGVPEEKEFAARAYKIFHRLKTDGELPSAYEAELKLAKSKM